MATNKNSKKYSKIQAFSFVLIIILVVIGFREGAFSRDSSNWAVKKNNQQDNRIATGQVAAFSESNDFEVHKDEIEDSGKLNFRWSDSEISNKLGINSKGMIDWRALRNYPAECPNGQAIRKIGDRIECIDVGSDTSSEDEFSWQNLTSFPTGCPDGQAVKAIGETLTCADIENSEEDLFIDGGATTYLSSLTDNLALGGSNSSAPFFFDQGNSRLSVSKLRGGGSADYLSISDEGFMELNGNATVWEDFRVPVTSTTREGSKQPTFGKFKDNGGSSQGVFVFWFDQANEQELYFTVQIPHNYKSGSSIYPHVHWTPKTNGSAGQKVSWGLEYTWANIGSSYGNTNIIYANTTYPNETLDAGKHFMTSFSAISGTSKGFSSMLVCRVFRNATGAGSSTDDYADTAGLMEIDFHYEIDKLGTDEEY